MNVNLSLLRNFRNWLSEREMFGTEVVEEDETAFYAEYTFSVNLVVFEVSTRLYGCTSLCSPLSRCSQQTVESFRNAITLRTQLELLLSALCFLTC